tara:strand:- start:297 stop:710 length:414 start_codon:yes stop_codon:yes gene_type:complete
MNDKFFASIKLMTGEEIVAFVEVHDEGLIVNNPLLLEDMSALEDLFEDVKTSGLKLSKWIKSTTDNFFFIDDTKIVTINELIEPGLSHYKKAVTEINTHEKEYTNKIKRRSTQKKYQGYRASVNDARIFFEDLFNKY